MAFRQGLATLGWTESRNVQIKHRFASGDFGRIQALSTELVGSAPDLIVASSAPVVAALKEATRTVPIVFCLVIDPVGMGFVTSLARPGGNITGFTPFEFPIIGKWLETLKEIDPGIRWIAFVFNPQTAPYYSVLLREFEAGAASLAAELSATPVLDEAEMEVAITALARQPGGGLIVAPEPFTITRRGLIVRLAERIDSPQSAAFGSSSRKAR